MRIGIDIRCLVEGRRTGVEEYTINLLTHLFAVDKKNDYVLFLNSFSRPAFDPGLFKEYKNVSVKTFRFPNKLLNFCLWYFRWPKIDILLGGADILFFPNIIFAAASSGTRIIQTFHDLSFEICPETFSFKRRLWHSFVNPGGLARRADRIIAVSESTADDLVDIYKIDRNKIKIIYSAAPPGFSKIDRNDPKMVALRKKYGLPYKFILFLGTVEPRKNIGSLVRAFNEIKKYVHPEIEKVRLVIAGSRGWKQSQIQDEIEKSPFRQDIILPGFIAEEDKPYVYNLATVFVYPSFYEGFGFPPLEAMSCGVPVVASNNSSLPEIVGDAGILVDPDRPDELARAIKELLVNKELADLMREKGLFRAKDFQWQKAAEKFLEIINEM